MDERQTSKRMSSSSSSGSKPRLRPLSHSFSPMSKKQVQEQDEAANEAPRRSSYRLDRISALKLTPSAPPPAAPPPPPPPPPPPAETAAAAAAEVAATPTFPIESSTANAAPAPAVFDDVDTNNHPVNPFQSNHEDGGGGGGGGGGETSTLSTYNSYQHQYNPRSYSPKAMTPPKITSFVEEDDSSILTYQQQQRLTLLQAGPSFLRRQSQSSQSRLPKSLMSSFMGRNANVNVGRSNSATGGASSLSELLERIRIINLASCGVAVLFELPTLLGHVFGLHPARAVLGLYLCGFALVLGGGYEGMRHHSQPVDRFLQQYFGLLFHPLGRVFWMCLMAGLAIGQHTPLDYLVGSALLANSVQIVFVCFKFPDANGYDAEFTFHEDAERAAAGDDPDDDVRYTMGSPYFRNAMKKTATNDHDKDDGIVSNEWGWILSGFKGGGIGDGGGGGAAAAAAGGGAAGAPWTHPEMAISVATTAASSVLTQEEQRSLLSHAAARMTAQ